MNWNMLDPTTTICLWTTEGSNFSQGEFKSFWRKGKALLHAEYLATRYPYVDLKNEFTGAITRLKNNPEKIEPVYRDWRPSDLDQNTPIGVAGPSWMTPPNYGWTGGAMPSGWPMPQSGREAILEDIQNG